ncbi:hypothetical protein CRU87_05380 [Aliarcobacter trophiarum LMG 25534]|uniref:Periplasmic protein refolding chaperone, Spy/CpxP family (LTXXQ domains) n=1 Tax=Aliarcobacter trophiarum LMG 25534 TaxID=1032241 RepID=A0AAD0QJT9_9BACT|nr:Spy/CpxP family protein refolding chaperone [Aliarcobacter trophiarum]AXK49272.1 putative periplasmic protein refolding chaperone, Spy/CpxP family (LTXXQ domains) [Aliarcobacter trophiarum LMG 25534]RXI25309.1 hypothetical protein CRU89_08045 [Aliarcobacter trophiarum]RXJ91449.1 hypothetical protein CRU87_05380 [Aliarcobacter trophiarum LMG 25534]
MKKIVTSIALASILVSGLSAQGWQNCDFNQNHNYSKKGDRYYQKNYMPQRHYGNGNGMLWMFGELNLSSDQRAKIYDILKDSRANQEFPCDAFTKDSFDKNKFAKIMKDKQEKRFERQADVLEKAYKVLDSKQKEQLKTLLELRKNNMQQRFED